MSQVWDWILWCIGLIGVTGGASLLLWFWRKPKLIVELESRIDRPDEMIGTIHNEPITNSFARICHIQRKTAEHVLVHFLIRYVDGRDLQGKQGEWMEADVNTGHSFPSARIAVPPSVFRSTFIIGRIHPDSKAFHLEGDGALPPGCYTVTVRVEDDGIFRFTSRRLDVTEQSPFVYWVGPVFH